MNACIKYKNVKLNINYKIENRLCFHFDDIINGAKINFRNILLAKKLYENISVNNI